LSQRKAPKLLTVVFLSGFVSPPARPWWFWIDFSASTVSLSCRKGQATIGGHPRSMEIDLERGVEGELKELILYLTHWVLTSGAFAPRSDPPGY
jgi:hypothetical protein